MQKSQLKKLRAKEKSLARQLYGNMDAEQQGEDSSNEIGEKIHRYVILLRAREVGSTAKTTSTNMDINQETLAQKWTGNP